MNVPSARTALFVLVLLTVIVALVRFFEQNWVLGVTAATVVTGTGFVGAATYFTDTYPDNPQLEQAASKVRAIGLILIGLGTLFGALMLIQ